MNTRNIFVNENMHNFYRERHGSFVLNLQFVI